MELPVLKKVYCYRCNRWLSNQSLDDSFNVYKHDHEFQVGDWSLMVIGERRLDN